MGYEAFWAKEAPSKLTRDEFIKLEKDGLDVVRTIIEKYAVEQI